eukprot:TRINITY_DN41930_c0_g1_i1.p1 TRINITY_DN41930_c0_g1~~TRINITY_DN41930_c0_g1_i1.p1  ORF type:complete len:398 (-),score=54.03 TRINITY_DN41930_c0_g1_i1:190-1293(-)
MDCKFHPQQNKLLVSSISGHLTLLDVDVAEENNRNKRKFQELQINNDNETGQLWKLRVSKHSCRGVCFDGTQKLAITASQGDIMAVDVQTGKGLSKMVDGHDWDINKVLPLTESAFVAADDGGCMKIWDTRQKEEVFTFDHHQDAVSDVAIHDTEDCLIAVSEDGTLSVTDLRKLKLRAKSDEDDVEFLSVTTARSGDKVICGNSDGVLEIFSWGYFNGCSDRYPGHQEPIDCIQKIDDSNIITGCGDGKIRICSILPNKLLCEVGFHEYPVESMSLSASQQWLATTTHSPIVQLWNIRCLIDKYCGNVHTSKRCETQQDQEEDDDIVQVEKRKRKSKKQKASNLFKQVGKKVKDNFFEDLVNEARE